MLQSSDNVRPLRDRVFVKQLPWPNVSDGGLYLPDQSEKREEVWHAVVVAVGPGKPPIGLLRRALGLLADFEAAGGNAEHEPNSEATEGLMADVRDGIAVGFGADVKPGDVVLVSKYVHTKVRVGGEWCSIIAASDILGVVTDGGDQVGSVLRRALERHELNRAPEREREMAALRADPERKRHLAEANAIGEADAHAEKERRALLPAPRGLGGAG